MRRKVKKISKSLKDWWQKRARKHISYPRILRFLIFVWLIFSFFVYCNAYKLGMFSSIFKATLDSPTLYQYIQILLIPITGFAALIAALSNGMNRVRQEHLKKIEMTKDFVTEFEAIYSELMLLMRFRAEYYKKNKETNELFKTIQKMDMLEFDEKVFLKLLKQCDVELTTLDKLEEIDIKVEKGYIDNSEIAEWDSQDEAYGVVQKIIVDFNNKRNCYETDTSLNEEIKKEKLEKNALNTIKLLRDREQSVLNKLEGLCINVRFNMLSYEQIYHLLIHPYTAFIQAYYIPLMIKIMKEDKNNYVLYSNIRTLYDELIRNRMWYIKEINKIEEKFGDSMRIANKKVRNKDIVKE